MSSEGLWGVRPFCSTRDPQASCDELHSVHVRLTHSIMPDMGVHGQLACQGGHVVTFRMSPQKARSRQCM